MHITVVVPVYREPKFALDIAHKVLSSGYPDKEVVIAVDGEMTPDIEIALRSVEGRIRLFYPNRHLGKARLLNEAVASLEADVLLFLDNDILLPENPEFLFQLAGKMKHYDIVEMAKEVLKESFYSAMIGYEYIGFAMVHFLFSLASDRLPSVIGSAFAVKKTLFDHLGGFRYVVHEDVDFGARAFRLDAKYHYSVELRVKTTMPNTAKDWMKQRRRWTLINLLWFLENVPCILKRTFQTPSLIFSLLLTLSPAILSWIVFLLVNQDRTVYALSAFLLATQYHQYVSGIFLWFTHYSMITKGILVMALSLFLSVGIYAGFAAFLRFRFRLWEYLIYYFFYMPIIVVIHVFMFFQLLFQRKIQIEWKLAEEQAVSTAKVLTAKTWSAGRKNAACGRARKLER